MNLVRKNKQELLAKLQKSKQKEKLLTYTQKQEKYKKC